MIGRIEMNVEQAFVKCSDVEPNVGLPSSYKTIIVLEEKRKVAVSEVISGWVSVIESKEVNDYKILLDLSNKLGRV